MGDHWLKRKVSTSPYNHHWSENSVKLSWAKTTTSCQQHLNLRRTPLENCASRRWCPSQPSLSTAPPAPGFHLVSQVWFRMIRCLKTHSKLICTVPFPASKEYIIMWIPDLWNQMLLVYLGFLAFHAFAASERNEVALLKEGKTFQRAVLNLHISGLAKLVSTMHWHYKYRHQRRLFFTFASVSSQSQKKKNTGNGEYNTVESSPTRRQVCCSLVVNRKRLMETRSTGCDRVNRTLKCTGISAHL